MRVPIESRASSSPVTLHLSADEATFLSDQLQRQLTTVESELVHTDARGMQRALAADLDRLRAICMRLAASRMT